MTGYLLDVFLRKVGHPTVNLATGFLSELGELNRLQWHSQHEIEGRILKRARSVAVHAYDNFRVYRQKFDSVGVNPKKIRSIEDFQKLPTVTKAELATSLKRDRVNDRSAGIPASSGGTTGQPLRFLADVNSSTAGLVSKIFFDNMAGVGPHEKKVAIHRIPSRTHSKDHVFLNEIQVSYASLLSDLGGIRDKVLRFKPKLIGSAASLVLAEFMAKNGDRAGDWLKAVVTWGLPLSQGSVNAISEALPAKIYDRYGSAELGWGHIAQQCSEGQGLHINTELSLIEVVRNGELCSEGERGGLVITNFHNFVTPFVRYEQGDTAMPLTDCACGRKLPQICQIEGKDSSLIELRNGIHVPTAILRSLVRRLVESRYIERVHFRQESSSSLTLTIIPQSEFSSETATIIQRKLNSLLGGLIDLIVEVGDEKS